MAASPENATTKGQVVREGHLPVSEFLFTRPGAGSPFGEEVTFPLPVDGLNYRHPERPEPRER